MAIIAVTLNVNNSNNISSSLGHPGMKQKPLTLILRTHHRPKTLTALCGVDVPVVVDPSPILLDGDQQK